MSAPSTPLAEQLQAEQAAILRRNLPFSLCGALLTVGLVWAAMREAVPAWQMLAWFLAQAAWTLVRAWGVSRYRRGAGDAGGVARWRLTAIATTGVAGLLWGIPFAYWMLHVDLPHQMFLIVALLTLGTGAIYAYCIDLPLLYAFQVPYFSLPFIAILTIPGTMHTVLALAAALYLAVTLVFAQRMSRTQIDSLRLRFENLSLVESLQREKEAAERSDLAKSRFLAAASHDLRQPVHALSLFIGVLKEQPLPDESRRLVDSVGRAASALGTLFEALLNISRLDAGVVRVNRRTFALTALFDQLLLEFTPQADAKSLVLRVRPTRAVVYTDPALLDRILRNLVDNAIRNTQRGGVLLACRPRRGAWRIEVWDTGAGIPAAEQDKVFWEFHQLNNPERDRGKGLGLGLAIVRRTAKLLGHAVGLRSRPGRGSVFAITVPRMAEQHAGQPEAPPPGHSAGALKGRLVFVVDDDIENRQGLQLLLEAWGCRVVAGGSGEEIVQAAARRNERPDLIISDYRLRNHETGIEVIDALHEEFNDENIPAMLISGDTDPQRLAEAAARTWPLMHKPVEPAELREVLVRMLG